MSTFFKRNPHVESLTGDHVTCVNKTTRTGFQEKRNISTLLQRNIIVYAFYVLRHVLGNNRGGEQLHTTVKTIALGWGGVFNEGPSFAHII